jgi:hypothetical protein
MAERVVDICRHQKNDWLQAELCRLCRDVACASPVPAVNERVLQLVYGRGNQKRYKRAKSYGGGGIVLYGIIRACGGGCCTLPSSPRTAPVDITSIQISRTFPDRVVFPLGPTLKV